MADLRASMVQLISMVPSGRFFVRKKWNIFCAQKMLHVRCTSNRSFSSGSSTQEQSRDHSTTQQSRDHSNRDAKKDPERVSRLLHNSLKLLREFRNLFSKNGVKLSGESQEEETVLQFLQDVDELEEE